MKLVKLFICSLVIILTTSLIGKEGYDTHLPFSLISANSQSSGLSLNENGSVLCYFGNAYAIWHNDNSYEVIDNPDNIHFIKMGNDESIIGKQSKWPYLPVLWKKESGITEIDISRDISNIHQQHKGIFSADLIDLNSSGTLIGNYINTDEKKQSFIWKSGKATRFSIEAEAFYQGYTVSSTSVISINEHGAILGRFEYGAKHPLKNQWINEGFRYFLWTDRLHIIAPPMGIKATGPVNGIIPLFYPTDLNNHNAVLFASEDTLNNTCDTYLWTPESGLDLILESYLGGNLNDQNQILHATYWNPRPILFEHSQKIDFSQELEKLGIREAFFNQINNSGDILGRGLIWGEHHFFKLVRRKD